MKNILILCILLIAHYSFAQSTIIDTYGDAPNGEVVNAYYKDIEQFQDQFEGTWRYVDGTDTLTVVLQKKPMFYMTDGPTPHYADIVVGEYRYVDNGVEKVNTLNNFTLEHTSVFDYNLYGDIKLGNSHAPECNSCPVNTERLKLEFKEPSREFPWAPQADFVVRVVVIGNVTQMVATFRQTYSAYDAPSPEMEVFSLPYGEYVLIKQP